MTADAAIDEELRVDRMRARMALHTCNNNSNQAPLAIRPQTASSARVGEQDLEVEQDVAQSPRPGLVAASQADRDVAYLVFVDAEMSHPRQFLATPGKSTHRRTDVVSGAPRSAPGPCPLRTR